MKLIKYFIPLLVLFLSIGYAATNVTMSITGDAAIASDIEDFEVYISSIKLNGETDISLLKSELEFELGIENTETLEYEIEYDITNASKGFDAIIEVNCQYLTSNQVEDEYENSFDISMPLEARTSRNGKVLLSTLEPFAEDEDSRTLNCKIEAIPIERTEYGQGEIPEAITQSKLKYIDSNSNENIDIGDEVKIQEEKFNIINVDEDNITMLAKYNLSNQYTQSSIANLVIFSQGYGWEYTPGPQEIDIQTWSNKPKEYVNAYVLYLQTTLESTLISGDLITLKTLEELGCTITEDYSVSLKSTCENSPHKEWLINGQDWWTKSAVQDNGEEIWYVDGSSIIFKMTYAPDENGIRPIITIPYNQFIEWTQPSNQVNSTSDVLTSTEAE